MRHFKYAYSCWLIRVNRDEQGLLTTGSCRVGDLFATKQAAKRAGLASFGYQTRLFHRVEVNKHRVSVSHWEAILSGPVQS